jgi:hypothetical protein
LRIQRRILLARIETGGSEDQRSDETSGVSHEHLYLNDAGCLLRHSS